MVLKNAGCVSISIAALAAAASLREFILGLRLGQAALDSDCVTIIPVAPQLACPTAPLFAAHP